MKNLGEPRNKGDMAIPLGNYLTCSNYEKNIAIFTCSTYIAYVGVSRMDRVRNEEVRRRAGIEREFSE